MIDRNDLKIKVVYHLKNFSSDKKALSSKYFHDQLAVQDLISLREFQRLLADIISEINIDQMTYEEFVVCSCNDGYFIPRTEEGYLKGRNYLESKIDEVQQRIRWIDQMRLKLIYGKSRIGADLFS